MKPRRPIRRATPARAKELSRYRMLKAMFLMEHDTCEHCGRWCNPYARQLHHRFGRVKALLCYVPEFVMLCGNCHWWVENNRNEAVKCGCRGSNRLFNRPSLVIDKAQAGCV